MESTTKPGILDTNTEHTIPIFRGCIFAVLQHYSLTGHRMVMRGFEGHDVFSVLYIRAYIQAPIPVRGLIISPSVSIGFPAARGQRARISLSEITLGAEGFRFSFYPFIY